MGMNSIKQKETGFKGILDFMNGIFSSYLLDLNQSINPSIH
jgi:hypothetical protein